MKLNRDRNADLKNDLARLGFGYYPVNGAGQSDRRILGFRYIVPSNEESFVVQPRGQMNEDQFLNILNQLLVKYDQYASAVRVPRNPMSFLLVNDGDQIPLGTSAEPRKPGEPYYTALKRGARADDKMLDHWELHGENNPIRQAINWLRGRSDMNRPTAKRGGRRFVIKNPVPFPKGDTTDVKVV